MNTLALSEKMLPTEFEPFSTWEKKKKIDGGDHSTSEKDHICGDAWKVWFFGLTFQAMLFSYESK